MAAPLSTIHVCGSLAKLTNRYDHTLYFETIEAQTRYFDLCSVYEFNDYTFLRDRWTIKVKAAHHNAREWTYLFFDNYASGLTWHKRYYYFITHVDYINENCVELHLEMDVIQTYLFDWKLRPCYVEREHSETDEIGENTVDEGLDVGDFVTAAKESINLSDDMMILVAASIDAPKFYYSGAQTEDKIFASKYGNIFGGFQITGTGTHNGVPTFGGITPRKSSSRKYACPCCGMSVRATKVVNIACMDCDEQLLLVG